MIMKDCERCKNVAICKLEKTRDKCAFVNPFEEIPIIHGKAELEEHDKQIRNKAIDEFANFIHGKAKENNGLRLSGETRSWTHASIFDYVNEFRAEQMKGEQ